MSENKKAKCIMVQGTMCGAGKSLLCAALCRIFAQDGLHTAPFKSQNMALNSFVTRDGLEMGRAQVVQAQAAGVEPDVRMNPILLKPSSDVGSQVIVNGEVRGQMKASQYFKMKKSLIPDILRAYNSLAEGFDVIVIEGAGSPAEINLKADDIVNMGLAKLVDAPVLLVGDIDGVQLFGTVELLETDERDRIKGLVINKFRGDVEILRPGLSMLEDKTHLPVLGVVPYLRVDIEDEDSLSERLEKKDAVRPLDIAVIRLPHISNFTDFMVLEQHPLMDVRYVQNTRELGAPDLVILPGTKNTVEDLLWLRQSGLEAVILKLAAKETPVLGVCGGYQMLGETLHDPDGSESGRPQTLRGLNLLPTETTFCTEKHRAQVTGEVIAAPFTGAMLTGYEIHTGNTIVRGEPFCTHADGTKEGCINQNVFGTYLHGLFDSGELTEKACEIPLRPQGDRPRSRRACFHGGIPPRAARHFSRRRAEQPRYGCRIPRYGHGKPEGVQSMIPQHHLPADIERTSMQIIARELEERHIRIPRENLAVVKRVIHTTADFEYAETLHFTENAVQKAIEALHNGATIITDTNMALAGVSKPGLKKLNGEALCFMADPAVAQSAKESGTTRAVAAMHKAAKEYPGAILAVGNAPTALFAIAEEIENGLRPALVIGVSGRRTSSKPKKTFRRVQHHILHRRIWAQRARHRPQDGVHHAAGNNAAKFLLTRLSFSLIYRHRFCEEIK